MASELRRVGVHGETYFEAVQPDDAGEFGTAEIKGRFLGHLALLKRAAGANVSGLVILEDVVTFADDASWRSSQIMRRINQEAPDWGMFYGAYLGLPVGGGDIYEAVNHQMPVWPASLVCFSGHVIPEIAAYLDRMLDRPRGDPDGYSMDIDAAYAWFRRTHPECLTFVATPALAKRRSESGNWFKGAPLVRRIMRGLTA